WQCLLGAKAVRRRGGTSARRVRRHESARSPNPQEKQSQAAPIPGKVGGAVRRLGQGGRGIPVAEGTGRRESTAAMRSPLYSKVPDRRSQKTDRQTGRAVRGLWRRRGRSSSQRTIGTTLPFANREPGGHGGRTAIPHRASSAFGRQAPWPGLA